MLVDRHTPLDLFAFVPQLQATFEPELRELDRLLEDDRLFQAVKADLVRRAPQSRTRGRPGTPVEVVLRMLVVKRLYRWSYEETEHFVGDSLVLRQFCRVYLQPVPDDTTLLRWARLIRPETLEQLNDRAVALARSLKVTRGRKLRVDSFVVETNIHHPTDSGIVGDGVRVVSRLLHRARAVAGEELGLSKQTFQGHVRSARRLLQHLHRLARHKGEEATAAMAAAYERLVAMGKRTLAQGKRVRAALASARSASAQRLVRQLDAVLPLLERAAVQAKRRVLEGEAVPAKEKLLSLFEPHTQLIVRNKAGKRVEFGRKVWLEEVEGGIVEGWRVLPEPGQDYPYLVPSLGAHRRRFGGPPHLVTGDRGVTTKDNEAAATRLGVKQVVLPQRGRVSPKRREVERRAWCRRGRRFRAGVEGRVSVLRRGYELNRCRDHGEAGMGRWVGWGVLTANLAKIAQTVAGRRAEAGRAA
jgi:transposase, IS5 family